MEVNGHAPKPPKPERENFDVYMMRLAVDISRRSTCRSRKVGCVITDWAGRIAATGYNGVPRKCGHCDEQEGGCRPFIAQLGPPEQVKCLGIHAEANALMHAKDILALHALYVTTAPCFECAKLICNTTIERVIWMEDYREPHGPNLLRAAGKQCLKVTP